MGGQRMGGEDWAMLVGLSVLWGGSFVFAEVAVGYLPPLTVVLVRVALAAAALVVVAVLVGAALPRGRVAWGALLVMGLLNNAVPFALIVWGQTMIASGLAAILNATTPLFAVVFAHLLTRDERLTGPRLAGVAAGIAGVAVLVGPAALAGAGAGLAGQVAVLGAAASYALAGIWGRRFAGLGLGPLATATGQAAAATLVLLPLALAVDRPWTLPVPPPAGLGALAGLALLSTALAYLAYFRLLARVGPTRLLFVTFLIPVSAALLGWAVLGERLEARHAAGMALIALGLAALEPRRRAARQA